MLGLTKSASSADIKKAYKELSRKYHPDKNGGDDAKFVEISAAYEVLSDDQKRKTYDQFGEEGVNGQQHQQHHQQRRGGGNPFDFFGGGGFQHQQMRRRGHNTETHVKVTLVQMYRGENLDLSVNLQGLCDKCDGTGSADKKVETCSVCHGSGMRIVQVQLAPGMTQQIQTQCDRCQGKGHTIKTPCKKCRGTRVMRENRSYHLHIKPGSDKKFDHVFRGEADKVPDVESGDLIVHVSEDKSGNMGYRRKGRNLFRTEVLSEREATSGGWKRRIPSLDGESFIELKRASGVPVSNREVEVLKKQGMPVLDKDDEYGNLFIKYVVILSGKKSGKNRGKDEL